MASEDDDPWRANRKDVRTALDTVGTEGTVVTVADVEGSAYRRPGAKMVVTAAGIDRGAVTAGCLEPSVVDICESVRETGRSRTERFDLTESGESWGLGLGCNGIIDLLIEPRDRSWDVILEAVQASVPITVVTIVESDAETAVGDRVVIDDGVRSVPDRDDIPDRYLDRARDTVDRVAGTGQTATVSSGDTTLLVDSLEPTPELLLFGSQNDLGPVVSLGNRAGFAVSVHSPRGGIDESAFPRADVVRTGHPSTVSDGVGDHTYAVVMSHNLVDDKLALETLLRETNLSYVGVMGPRERFDRIRSEISLTTDELDRVAAPVGLDLGGSTPTDIALSIVSEVVAVHNGRDGGRLREQSGPIHPTETGR